MTRSLVRLACCLLLACAPEPGASPDAGDLAVDAGVAPDAPPGADAGPTRYPADAFRSPITPAVAAKLAAIRSLAPTPADDVFMKVGASGTVSPNLLYCFAGLSQPQYLLELDGRDALLATIDHFRGGDAAGATPFDRPSLAAEVGRTASWAVSGEPSPLELEIQALNPRFALVNYGTNDMNMGTTHRAALFPFYENMSLLLDDVEGRGIVPVVTGLNPRADTEAAARWVPTYDAVTRGLAEARQVPYISLYQAAVGLPNLGLLADGIHGNVYLVDGAAQPCVFTAAGLAYNYDVRNLVTIETLDALRRVLVDGEPAPDEPPPPLAGDGTAERPFIVDTLPFTHAADTRLAPSGSIDGYPACDSGQDESGPELHYRLGLDAPTPVRIVVLDRDAVDVDLHLLGTTPDPGGCRARDDRILELPLEAGDHHLVVDTYVGADGAPQAGEYLLVVVACGDDDPECLAW